MQCAVVAPSAGKSEVTVGAADQRSRVARVVVEGVSHQLDSELILAHREVIDVVPTERDVVVKLIRSALIRECHHSLLGERPVQFELSKLQVEPRRALDVVDSNVGRLKTYRTGHAIDGRHQQEGNVFGERSPRQDVDAREIEARGVYGSLNRAIARLHRLMSGAFIVPVRSNAHGHRPVRRVHPDRRIAIVVELIAVVFEVLSEAIQLRPCFVTCGAGQPILSGEGRDRISGRAIQDHQQQQQPGKINSRADLLTIRANTGGLKHTILSAV